MARVNSYGQPIGEPVAFSPREEVPRTPLTGRYCRLEPLDPERHALELFEANSRDDGRNWTYLAIGPFPAFPDYRAWLEAVSLERDPIFFAVVDGGLNRAVGVASLMRIDRNAGTIEVGNINFSPLLQRAPAATEAMYLLMRRVFEELGFRRYEWKCDSLNAPSRRAAERLGFTFEGVFRQALVYKGRNRDTAWFSVVDSEWPVRKAAFEAWLDPANFDEVGRQRCTLESFRAG